MRTERTENRKSGTVISKSGAIDLIVFIAEKVEIQALDLMKVHKNYARMFRLTRELESIGILKVIETTVPRLTYTIKLTPKGEKVAEKLREALETINR
jgi:predicted transcriptional regulator